MFTGIIETLGRVTEIAHEGTNTHFTIASDISDALKVDQSVSHNGACLTVVEVKDGTHTVTAIAETLKLTSLGRLEVGSRVNLERAMLANARLDGHMVQGHVDMTGTCTSVESVDGSWYFRFEYEANPDYLLVNKGSICIDGVSLTVVEPTNSTFSVAIIPYTYEHTGFGTLRAGQRVNLEFDVIGKYVARYVAAYGVEGLLERKVS